MDADIQQRRCGGECGHRLRQRREPQAGKHQHAHGNGSEPGTAARSHAGGAFHIRRGGGSAQNRPGHDGHGIGKQGFFQARQLAVFQQAGTMRHTHQRAGAIEQIYQEKYENYRNQAT